MKSSSKPAPSGAAKKTKKRSPLGKFTFTLVKFVLISLIALSCALAGLVGGAVYGWLKTAPKVDFEKLTGNMNQTTFIYDSKNNVISKLTGKDNKDSEPISYEQAPKFLKDAIISIEDERFEEHPGIDIQGIINAGIGYVQGFITNNPNAARGGSTITQQVIKNITNNTQVTPQRKVQEWAAAIDLEKKCSKWQILEMYMNYSYFGNSCRGVQSASKKYFGKDVWDLSLAQCALLTGITNSPGKNNPFTENGRKEAKSRQELILKKMLELKKIDQRQYDQAVSEPMIYAEKSESAKVTNVQSYFVDQVINDVKQALMKEKNVSSSMALYMIYNGGLKIYTTQDPDMQADMDEIFLNDEYFPTENKTAKKYLEHPQAAMVILDAQNGQIKAIYGGYGKKEASNTLNRASGIARQPGSSIKPIAVYAPSIDLGVITPATVIDDVPVYMRANDQSATQKQREDTYPDNYNSEYDGLTSVRNGLKASINVVAAKIWMDYLKPDNSLAYLKKVGIDRDERYLSLILGGPTKGVNPLQMAAAYLPFAHKGMYYEPTSFTVVKDSEDTLLLDKKPKYDTAYSEQTASIMADMMQEVTKGQTSPYPHSGTAAGYVTEKTIGMPVAGKTGTTSDNLDKWFVGYTPYYVAATWYGYDNDNEDKVRIKLLPPEYNQALKIWATVMSKVHKNLEKKEFVMASGLVKKNICIYSGKIATALCAADPRGNATREEYFIKGTEPRDDDLCTVHVQAQVCTESQDVFKRNLLAGPYCPAASVVDKVFIQRLVPYVPTKPDEKPPNDMAYELPAGEYCTVHGAPAGNQTGFIISEPEKTTQQSENVGEPIVEEQPLE